MRSLLIRADERASGPASARCTDWTRSDSRGADADLTLKAARATGVRIAAGHDWHPFWNTAIEIRRMIAHGLSATEALASATAGSAYALGLEAHIGSVEPGRLADLLALDGDPLERPEMLSERERVWLVIQHGTPVAGAALERKFD